MGDMIQMPEGKKCAMSLATCQQPNNLFKFFLKKHILFCCTMQEICSNSVSQREENYYCSTSLFLSGLLEIRCCCLMKCWILVLQLNTPETIHLNALFYRSLVHVLPVFSVLDLIMKVTNVHHKMAANPFWLFTKYLEISNIDWGQLLKIAFMFRLCLTHADLKYWLHSKYLS